MRKAKAIRPVALAKPSIWGPSGWHFLHSVASCYPERPTETEIQHYLVFFNSIGPVLPCKLCRSHYADYLARHPLDKALRSGREALVLWWFRFHNFVRRRLGKKPYTRQNLPQYFEQKVGKTLP